MLHTGAVARSIWNGLLRFGLVTIPVGLVPSQVDRGTGFRTLHRECGTPVNRCAWCAVHERVVEASELVMGYEVAEGQFVPVEDAELEAIVPEASKDIEIRCLLDAARLDPGQVERTYYLSASETPIGRRPYVLLLTVLRDQNRAAIARLVFRGAEWVSAVRPHPTRDLLLLHKLAFADEVVDAGPLERDLRDVELQDGELELAAELGAKLWRTKPSAKIFESEHAVRVRALVDTKLAGGEIVRAPAVATEAMTMPTADLSEQLRASLKKPKPRPGAGAVKS